jgi:hypothetical protein
MQISKLERRKQAPLDLSEIAAEWKRRREAAVYGRLQRLLNRFGRVAARRLRQWNALSILPASFACRSRSS